MPTNEKYNQYVAQYMKENIKHVKVSLNKRKEEDQKMLKWIEEQPEGASGYIKKLIRSDMAQI